MMIIPPNVNLTLNRLQIFQCMIYMIYIHVNIYLRDIISINAHLRHLNNATALLCKQSFLTKHKHVLGQKNSHSVDFEGGGNTSF